MACRWIQFNGGLCVALAALSSFLASDTSSPVDILALAGETELDHVLDIKDGGAHAMPEDALPTLQQNPCLRLIGLVLPMTTRYDPRGSFFVHVSELGLDHGETLPLTLDAPVSAHHARWRRACGIVWSLLKTAGRLFMLPIRLCARVMTLDQWHATPLFAVLVVVETTDVVFAADSIPAVLSITQDPFIAYTSNVRVSSVDSDSLKD